MIVNGRTSFACATHTDASLSPLQGALPSKARHCRSIANFCGVVADGFAADRARPCLNEASAEVLGPGVGVKRVDLSFLPDLGPVRKGVMPLLRARTGSSSLPSCRAAELIMQAANHANRQTTFAIEHFGEAAAGRLRGGWPHKHQSVSPARRAGAIRRIVRGRITAPPRVLTRLHSRPRCGPASCQLLYSTSLKSMRHSACGRQST